jgi:enoyl-CoA hydratase/carnithine racemase
MTAVHVTREGAVAIVTVDNPPANAISFPVFDGLDVAARALEADAEVRAVVLTGSGSTAFMAGGDVHDFQRLTAEGPAAFERYAAAAREIFGRWERLPQPVIAALQATALGGGLEFAFVCDFIVLDPAARVGFPEVRIGFIPGGGGTQRLARRVGAAKAKEILMLGGMLNAEEAVALGLVDRLSAPGATVAEAVELAHRLAAQPAIAVQAIKRCVNAASLDSYADEVGRERPEIGRVLRSADFREGCDAFLAKRSPTFKHR